MSIPRRVGPWLLALLLAAFGAVARAAPADTGETLDSLMAGRLSDDTTFVVMVETRSLSLRGKVETLPAPGKTTYMVEELRARRIEHPSRVGHKMWLKSEGGARVMVYVADDVAGRLKREIPPGAEIEFIALHLWNSRHGPGLLLTGFEATGLWRDRVIKWFGGRK